MTILKIYDANVLIRIIKEIHFPEIILNWHLNVNYDQWTTYEVNSEIKRKARKRIDLLISRGILKIFDPVHKKELEKIKNLAPKLSLQDCSLFYYCIKFSSTICLSDDNDLRKLFVRNNLELHGTYGIYLKLLNDNIFSVEDIEKKFQNLKTDARIFPN